MDVSLALGQRLSVQNQSRGLIGVDHEHEVVVILSLGVLGRGERVVCRVLFDGWDRDEAWIGLVRM